MTVLFMAMAVFSLFWVLVGVGVGGIKKKEEEKTQFKVDLLVLIVIGAIQIHFSFFFDRMSSK